MNFLFPGFLWALLALFIPIIVHLFNFRRYKKVYFSNVRFLKELKQESESKSKLKQYLLLLSRLLAITALVFAFAQPYFPGTDSSKVVGQKAISIFVDNSFSMETVSSNGYLLDVAKSRARELAKGFSPTDKFQLLTNDFEGKHQRLLNREEFFQLLDEVKLSTAHRKINEVYLRQKDLLDQSLCKTKRSYILSDFQNSFVDIKDLNPDTTIVCHLMSLLVKSIPGSNVFIDSCWFEYPVQQIGSVQKLHVKIKNKSSKELENSSLRLSINGKLISPSSFSARPNEEKEVIVSFAIKDYGIHQAKLELDDHPVTYDDKLFFSFNVEKRIPVLLINGDGSNSGKALLSMLKGDSLFDANEMKESAIDFNSFSKYNLIIFNDVKNISSGSQQEIKKFISNGGSFALFPATASDLTNYNELFSQLSVNLFSNIDTTDLSCERINFEQGFFADVFEKKSDNMDLPKSMNHFSISKGSRNSEENILRLMNGTSFFSQYVFGKGKIYICSSSLDERWTNFSRHALFVPAIYKMAINSQLSRALYLITGENTSIELQRKDSDKEVSYQVASDDGKLSFIPETRSAENKTLLFMHHMVQNSGNYFIEYEKERILGISFNYPREESVLDYFSVQKLEELFHSKYPKGFKIINAGENNFQELIGNSEGGVKLWKVFIILTLVFFAIEIALGRLLK